MKTSNSFIKVNECLLTSHQLDVMAVVNDFESHRQTHADKGEQRIFGDLHLCQSCESHGAVCIEWE